MMRQAPVALQRAPAPPDALGHTLRDLPIAVIDRCNVRGLYRMPEEACPEDHTFLRARDRLEFDEVERIARAFVSLPAAGGSRVRWHRPATTCACCCARANRMMGCVQWRPESAATEAIATANVAPGSARQVCWSTLRCSGLAGGAVRGFRSPSFRQACQSCCAAIRNRLCCSVRSAAWIRAPVRKQCRQPRHDQVPDLFRGDTECANRQN